VSNLADSIKLTRSDIDKELSFLEFGINQTRSTQDILSGIELQLKKLNMYHAEAMGFEFKDRDVRGK